MTTKTEGTMDKEGRYTAGPWLAADDYILAGSYTIARIFPNTGNESANAKLIAAAPEMANLLREFEQLLIGPNERKHMSDLQERAEALLAKIGETP